MSEVVFRVVKEWDVVSVKVTPEGDKRLQKCEAEGLCTGCLKRIEEGEKVVRGQCDTCYPSSSRKIRAKPSVENTLIREGKLKKVGKPGPKPVNQYTRELAEL